MIVDMSTPRLSFIIPVIDRRDFDGSREAAREG